MAEYKTFRLGYATSMKRFPRVNCSFCRRTTLTERMASDASVNGACTAALDGLGGQTLPDVPDDGVAVKTIYVGVCDAVHSPQMDKADPTNFVGEHKRPLYC